MGYGNGGTDDDGGWDAYCRDMDPGRCECDGTGTVEERDHQSGNSYRAFCDCPIGQSRLLDERLRVSRADRGLAGPTPADDA